MTLNNQKPFYRKGWFKKTLITLASLIIFIALIILVTVYFIFTPARITPLVLNQANQFVKGDIRCESIELTFFSTFPQFGLQLNNGSVTVSSDSVPVASDSLLSFNKALVTVNPMAYLSDQTIDIRKVSLDEVHIYAYIDSIGTPNWERLLPETVPADTVAQDTVQTEFPRLEIGKIAVNRANLTFDDRMNGVFGNLSDFNLGLTGSLSKKVQNIDLHLDTRNILLWQRGDLLVRKLALELDTRLRANQETHTYTIDKGVIGINGIRLGIAGDIQGDTINKQLNLNIGFGLEIPNLAHVLQLIPTSLVKEAKDVQASGLVRLEGSLKGNYGKEQLPVISLNAQIEKGKVHYQGMPYGVDALDMRLKSTIDPANPKESNLVLEKFTFKGASSELEVTGRIEQPLTDPRIQTRLKGKVNFTELASTFPLQDSVRIEGVMSTDLQAQIRVADVQNSNWGKLNLQGSLKLEDLLLHVPADSLYARIREAGLAFGTNLEDKNILQGTTLLNGIVGFDGLRATLKNNRLEMDKTAVHLKSSPLKDTTSIVSMDVNAGFSHLYIQAADTLILNAGTTKVKLGIAPSRENPRKALLRSNLSFDSLAIAAGANKASLKQAGFELKSKQNATNTRHWITTGTLGFNELHAFTPAFPLPMYMPGTQITLEEDRFLLNKAAIQIGHSDMTLTGRLENLANAFFHKGTLHGNLGVSSRYINCNELIRALERPENGQQRPTETADSMPVSTEHVPADSSSTGVFVVPDRIDFTLTTDIDKVLFGKMEIEHILGDMTIRNQCIELSDLQLHTMAADMVTTMVYKADNTEQAYSGFDLNMKDIQVGKLVEFIPALDSLVPMLRSLDGTVNFHVAAETHLDKDLMPVIPSIQAAARVRGDSLVLMDGETFSEISKMLRFKNKERNVIDSVSVDMVIRNGQIDIYPFLIGMDRYLAAVGGKHNMDMSFDYHVSLLDSPIPFKVGVDIKGNMDDFKFKITKPRYKDLKKSTRTSPVDSTGVSVKARIREALRKKYETEIRDNN